MDVEKKIINLDDDDPKKVEIILFFFSPAHKNKQRVRKRNTIIIYYNNTINKSNNNNNIHIYISHPHAHTYMQSINQIYIEVDNLLFLDISSR